jgi:hypothetical protein
MSDTHLYVSTSLLYFESPKSAPLGPDFRWHGITYRKLDPQYFSWLKSRIDSLAQITDTTRLAPESYIETLNLFSSIQSWVLQRIDKDKLDAMVEAFNKEQAQKRTYEPPEQ